MTGLNFEAIDKAVEACKGVSAEAIDAIGGLQTEERQVLKMLLQRISPEPARRGRKPGSKNRKTEGATA